MSLSLFTIPCNQASVGARTIQQDNSFINQVCGNDCPSLNSIVRLDANIQKSITNILLSKKFKLSKIPGAIDIILAHCRDANLKWLDPVDEQTPLRVAILLHDATLLRVLLEHGAAVGETIEVEAGSICQSFSVRIMKGGRKLPLIHLMLLSLLGSSRGMYDWVTLDEEFHKCIRLLAKHGININALDECGRTASLIAIKMRVRVRVLEQLLDVGADIEKKVEYSPAYYHGYTLLHLAVDENQVGMIKLLLSRGANINSIDYHGRTPAHIASKIGRTDIIRILLDHGANAELEDEDGKRLIHYANRQVDLFEFELVIEVLISYGVDLDAQDKSGRTALHYAARKSFDYDSLELLLHAGADPEIKSELGLTPLHEALRNGAYEAVRILLGHGAKVDEFDNRGKRPIHLALFDKRYMGFLGLFLRHGADLNARDSTGFTALHYLILGKYDDCDRNESWLAGEDVGCNEFWLAGADVSVTTNSGKTPLSLIRGYHKDHKVLAEILLKNQTAGFDIQEQDLQKLRETDHNLKIEEYLKRELESMKNVELNNSTTLYDIATRKDHDYLVDYGLAKKLELMSFCEFPQYASWLERKIRLDKIRYEAVVSFYVLIRMRCVRNKVAKQMIPRELIEIILSHSSIADLKNLKLCFSKSRKSALMRIYNHFYARI